MITFPQILERIKAIGAFGFSIEVEPKESQITAANRVIAFLQDRRVLYEPGEQQVPEYCTISIREIREFLRSEILKNPGGELSGHLKAMAGACRKFLSFEQTQKNWEAFNPLFCDALSQMRAIFGEHIAFIAARYKANLKDELERILPVSDKD